MRIEVRYFASLREALGERQSLEGLPDALTVGGLRAHLAGTSQAHAAALGQTRAVRCAVNQVMVDEGTAIPDGAEVAFFPPVTGG